MIITTILLTTLTIYSLSTIEERKIARKNEERELDLMLKESKRTREKRALTNV